MNTALKIPGASDVPVPGASVPQADRPAWIPPEILYDWDTDPYAYQTEEELMPAGGPHGQLLGYVMEVLQTFQKSQGRMLLMDAFMLYRNNRGIKRRVAPDLLAMPFRFPAPSSYDLDTEPPPLAVMEVTSPKSHLKDKEDNVLFYAGLGIPAYLVIDAITPQNRLREEIGLCLWRATKGQVRQMQPDREGYLLLPEINMKIRAEGYRMIFAEITTGRILKDNRQLQIMVAEERLRAAQERLRAEIAEKTAEQARQSAAEERLRAERLAEKLRSVGIDPDEIEI
ncbi:Uma2 family endonuclease [Desulfobacterales bacterium HSG2]|nr:Uma2 family endonuclease [Desulfobacterales bacterium HSG2]